MAFLVPSLFPLLPSVFATVQIRDVGDDVKGLERTTLIEDLRTQVHLEIDQIPDPDRLVGGEGPNNLFHGDRARVLCRSLAKQLATDKGITAVTRLETMVERYLGAGRILASEAALNGPNALLGPGPGEEARTSYDALSKAISPEQGKSLLEPVAEEAHDAVAAVAERSERRARRTLLTFAMGFGAAIALTFFA